MSEDAAGLVEALLLPGDPCAALRRRAAAVAGTVLLPEAIDPRVLRAAIALRELAIARPVLVGPAKLLRAAIATEGADPGAFEVVDPLDDARREALALALHDRRCARGMRLDEARTLVDDPLQFAAGLLAAGAADALVAGATHSTADVIRAGLHHVGLAEGVTLLSGAFLMMPPAGGRFERALYFADSVVLPEPDDDQLVAIGQASADNFEAIVGEVARIACLSFSTKGSAQHPLAARMQAVAQRLCDRGLIADGELQLDAALMPEVASGKAVGGEVAGRANVLLFPDLNSGNIGYKLAQRLGGFEAIGPILQGFRRPLYDLSRGCTARDVVHTVAVALLEANRRTDR